MSIEQFARTLSKRMDEKGITQAELARRTELTRTSISEYVRGRAIPKDSNLSKLEKALGVTLSPPRAKTKALFEFKVSSDDPTMAHLRIDGLVSFETCIKIATLLNDGASQP